MIKLKQIIEDIDLFDELEITHPLETSIEMLQNWGAWDNNKFIHYEIFDGIKILAKIDKITEEEFDRILKTSNSMGYFPSHLYTEHNNYGRKYSKEDAVNLIKNNTPFRIKFEAKFDMEIANTPKTLYHITDIKHKDKILKLGLCPKAKEKTAAHPGRVYLSFKKEDAYLFAYHPKSYIITPIMFEIDLTKSYKQIRLFVDPNFRNKGVYTYQNIPPNCLTIIDLLQKRN
jgi:hypothetical protein